MPDATSETIKTTVEKLRQRFASRETYSIDHRTFHLKQLAFLIKDNNDAICSAIKQDLGCGPTAVEISDLGPIRNEIELALARLPEWMKDESRFWDARLVYQVMNPKVRKQPKGVALIIGPWNYPWLCTIVPLINAVAAGCPAILKPSELAPASAALMAGLIPKYLDPEAYAVILGGPEVAKDLLKYQYGHICFTGSGRVGKLVAEAAAKTLTPTTLELGGKSPVIISPCADMKMIASRMMSTKQFNIGQICVAPDYILCVKEAYEPFVSAMRKVLAEQYTPSTSRSFLQTPMSSSLLNPAGFSRQKAILEQAEKMGKMIHRGEEDETTRRMGVSLVQMQPDGEGALVEDEIFGPVMAVICVDSIDAAIAYVNARPHPLALYVCSSRRAVYEHVQSHTLSGSVMWNDFSLVPMSSGIPFGGVGDSGWGSYHGYDGFRTFTHFKSTLEAHAWLEPIQRLRYPPFEPWKQRIITALLATRLGRLRRPGSVEQEKRARFRRERRKRALWVLVLILGIWVSGRMGWWRLYPWPLALSGR